MRHFRKPAHFEEQSAYALFLQEAVKATDVVFGEGYAADHPDLIGTLVQAMVIEASIQSATETLEQGLVSLTEAIKKGGLVEGR